MPIYQWVNLTQHEKFLGGPIGSLERLGRTSSFRIGFAETVPTSCSYELVPEGNGNVQLSQQESGDTRLKSHGKGTAHFPGGNQQKVVKATLPLTGGDQYKLQATAKSGQATSDVLTTARALFYKSIAMVNVQVPNLQPVIDTFWNTGWIRLIEKEAGTTTAYHETRNEHDAVPGGYVSSAFEKLDPYNFYVIWINHLVSRRAFPLKLPDFEVAAPPAGCVWDAQAGTLTIRIDPYLWHGFDANEDLVKSWFKSFKVVLLHADEKTTEKIVLTSSQVAISDAPAIQGQYGHREVRLTLGIANPGAVKYVFGAELTVDVTSWKAGFTEFNTIVVATGSEWQRRPDPDILRTLIHEIGHLTGMVPEARGASHYYNGKGHRGQHCSTGLTFNTVWTGTPQCVMFGGPGTAAGAKPSTFCSAGVGGNCAEVLRKLPILGIAQGLG